MIEYPHDKDGFDKKNIAITKYNQLPRSIAARYVVVIRDPETKMEFGDISVCKLTPVF